MNACVLAVAMLGVPFAASAAGFGKMTVLSNLGQPLSAEIDLVSVQPEEIQNLAVRLAPPDAFQERGVDYNAYLRGMRFQVARRDSGQYYVRVSSSQAINEPFVDFLVEMTWVGGRIVRQYTDVLDPADYAVASKPPTINVPTTTTTSRPLRSTPAAKPLAAGEGKPAVRRKRSRPAPASSEPPAATTAAADADSADTHRVRRGETLGQIAGRYRPSGVSLDQMLYGLYKNNTDAFVNRNINRLKSGAILQIPGKQEVSSISSAQAANEIRAHASDWNSYKQEVAAGVHKAPLTTATPQTSSTGKLTAKAEDKAAPAASGPRDVVKLSRGEAGKGNGAAAADARVRALEEEKAARERALREANERVALLEKNMKDMQRLLELRSKAAADLQKQSESKPLPGTAATKPAATTPAPVPAPVKTEVAPVKMASAPAAKPVLAPTARVASAPVASAVKASAPAASAVTASAAQASASVASAAMASAPKAASLPPAVPVKPASAPIEVEPVEQSSFFAENGLMLFGGALSLGVLGSALVFFMRRRRARPSFEDSVLTGGDLKSNTVLGSVGASIVDTSNTTDNSFFTDFSREGLGSIDTDEVDPVAEAEVYMAYGRDAQAEEILKDALLKDGSRQEVRLKLMEIYASRKNIPLFETAALELHGATAGAGPLWQRAAAMGRELDPSNALYRETVAEEPVVEEEPEPPLASLVSEPEAAAEAAPDLDLDFEIGTVKMQAVDVAEQPVVPAEESPVDFDLGGADEPAAAAAEETSPLDFDFSAEAPAAEAEAAIELPDEQAKTETPILDFHFDLGDVAPEAPMEETVRMNAPVLESAPAPAAPAADDHTTMGNEVPLNFSFGDLDLNLDKPASDEPVELELSAAPVDDSMAFSLDDLESAPASGVEDPIETKLDLAKAYMEMGDSEGAREILTEAAAEGTEEQRQRAERMLGEL